MVRGRGVRVDTGLELSFLDSLTAGKDRHYGAFVYRKDTPIFTR